MRCQSQQSAAVLLELMVKYKPHLKPYAYRLQSWGQVLHDYNSVMGTSYRQVRTIKNKFERLKYLYEHEPEHSHFQGYRDEMIQQLEMLIRDCDSVGTSSEIDRLVKKNTVIVDGEDSPEFAGKVGKKKTSVQRLNERIRRGSKDGSKSETEPTPPPLDTIVMGMPKNNFKTPMMKYGGLGIDYLVNGASPPPPFNNETNDDDDTTPKQVRDLVRKLTAEQAREDHEMAYKQQQLEGKFMTQADFLRYKKENRAVQLQILRLLSTLLEREDSV